jgi:hypothetical protein
MQVQGRLGEVHRTIRRVYQALIPCAYLIRASYGLDALETKPWSIHYEPLPRLG